MISEFFLNIVFNIVSGMFALLPDFSWNVDSSVFSHIMDILKFAGYIFPWSTVVAIAGLIVSISIFRIVVSAIKTLWDLLPLV